MILAKSKSLAEWAAEADSDKGIVCPNPNCRCRHCPELPKPFEVERTDPLGPQNSIARKRRCRNCGREFVTRERVIGAPE